MGIGVPYSLCWCCASDLRPRLIALFIVVLGAWGVFSSLMFESRARRHRARIDSIRVQLEAGFQPGAKTKQMVWVWVLFHTLIIVLGTALFFKLK